MFSYIFSHFFNHALGNVSYALMEKWLTFHIWWWRIPIVNVTLYAAAAIHFSLGLWALYQRRQFRYTVAEITQLLLGLSIPLWLASHFGVVRLAGWIYGRDPVNYAAPLFAYWVLRQHMIAVQFTLLTIAWTDACIDLYFWLRLKPFFKWAAPILLAVAVLLPPLAMIGAHHGAEEVTVLAKDPQWRAEHIKPTPPPQRAVLDEITLFYFPIGYAAALGLVFVARGVRSLPERRRGMVTVSYPRKQVRVPKGLSILEASLRFKVPHASVCGGRARCSTCRVRVVSDRASLPRPSRREAFVLDRVGAGDPSIRLACQLRPQTDVAVIPILPPHIGAVTEAGGQPNQFVGDGVLALFGLDVDRGTACRQALRAASLVASKVAYLNHQFATEVRDSIQYGIGIHAGEVIVGDIGFRDRTVFTALGDAVNVAARLQDMTKTLECRVMLSEEVASTAGITLDLLKRQRIEIRGRVEPMTVLTAEDPTVLAGLIDPQGETSETELEVA